MCQVDPPHDPGMRKRVGLLANVTRFNMYAQYASRCEIWWSWHRRSIKKYIFLFVGHVSSTAQHFWLLWLPTLLLPLVPTSSSTRILRKKPTTGIAINVVPLLSQCLLGRFPFAVLFTAFTFCKQLSSIFPVRDTLCSYSAVSLFPSRDLSKCGCAISTNR